MHFHPNNLTPSHKLSRLFRPGQVLFSAVLFLLSAVLIGLQSDVTQAEQAVGGGFSTYLPVVARGECYRYVEQNHLLVMEVEHAPAVDQWAIETALPGYTGESYYTWRGPNYYGTPGNAILTYHILINNPGEFNFRLHNRHDFPDPTEDNDVWVKMDSGPWIKAFSPVAGQWTWGTFFDFHDSQTNASYVLTAGPHTIQLSARSQDFSIDRIHLHKDPANEDASLPVSECI